jgi:hypothetical protein
VLDAMAFPSGPIFRPSNPGGDLIIYAQDSLIRARMAASDGGHEGVCAAIIAGWRIATFQNAHLCPMGRNLPSVLLKATVKRRCASAIDARCLDCTGAVGAGAIGSPQLRP